MKRVCQMTIIRFRRAGDVIRTRDLPLGEETHSLQSLTHFINVNVVDLVMPAAFRAFTNHL